MFFTIILFIIVLGVLILVHEFGHYIVAIRNGIKAEEFGFGFPPRIFGIHRDENTGKYVFVRGNKEVQSKNTIFSLNWLPFGGFVRIKGEDGHLHEGQTVDADSFVGKSAWVRVKVMGAGVFMNFILAWVLISIVLMVGFPQAIDSDTDRVKYPDTKIQITNTAKGSPAEQMGLQPGDELVKIAGIKPTSLENARKIILDNKGKEITFEVNRFGKALDLKGAPRTEYPENEGSLGIGFVETAIVSYPWYEAIFRGLETVYRMTVQILEAFGRMIAMLFGGEKVALDVTGPVGLVSWTKQMSDLGIVYLLQFMAILSINLGIINILPFPALDGGRIFFVILEKIKGKPVNQRLEMMLHQIGFFLLLALIILITIKDISRL